jgi:hypothetical protein
MTLVAKIRLLINLLVVLLSLSIIIFHIYIFLQPKYTLKMYDLTFKSNWLVLTVNAGILIGMVLQFINKPFYSGFLSFFLIGYILTVAFDYLLINQYSFWIYWGYIILLLAAMILNKITLNFKIIIFFVIWSIVLILLVRYTNVSLIL